MLKFFSKSFFPQYTAVFITGLVLWFPAFIKTPLLIEPDNYWGPIAVAFNRIAGLTGMAGTILAFFLTFITGMLTNTISGRFSLSDKSGTLPLFLFMLLASFTPEITVLSPFIVVLWFVILLFLILFKHEEKEENIMHSFDAGLIVGILTLIYYPLIIMLILIWFAFVSIKGINWRNFVVSIIGLLFPAFLIYSWYFFTGNEQLFFNSVSNIFVFNHYIPFTPFTNDNILVLFVTTLILLSAITIMNRQKDLSIRQRSFLTITGFYLLLSITIYLFFSPQTITFILMVPAASVTLYHLLSNNPKTRWVNIALSIFFIIVLINSWINLFDVTQ
jgi:hypothetical protein